MKIAICYSGQLGPFNKVLGEQKKRFLKKDWDAFIYTSQLVSQKVNKRANFNPISKIHEYLPAGQGWRKNTNSYGIIYEISNQDISNALAGLAPQIKQSLIEKESLEDSLEDHNLTKWEWLRKRQLRKMHNCNQLRKKYEKEKNINYDVIVRSRFDIIPVPVNVEKIYSSTPDAENKIFLFGGWPCTPPMVFMEEFICDGFAFGSPKVMDTFSSLYLKEEPYGFDPRFKDTWQKYGDNVEYQLRTHLEENNIDIKYIGNKRSMYHLWR